MSHATSQPANGLDFLGMQQLLLQLLALADVDECDNCPGDRAILDDRVGPKLHREADAVRTPENILRLVDQLSFPMGRMDLAFLLGAGCAVAESMVNQSMNFRSQELLFRIKSQHGEDGRVAEGAAAGRVQAENALRG